MKKINVVFFEHSCNVKKSFTNPNPGFAKTIILNFLYQH